MTPVEVSGVPSLFAALGGWYVTVLGIRLAKRWLST